MLHINCYYQLINELYFKLFRLLKMIFADLSNLYINVTMIIDLSTNFSLQLITIG